MICAVASVMAQDITTIPDNSLYTLDCSVKAGEKVSLSIQMKNSKTVESLMFRCTMPEGFSMAKDEEGYYVIELNSDRANKHTLFDPTFIDNEYRVAILQGGRAFKKNEGEILHFDVAVDEKVVPGDYEIKLTDVELSGDGTYEGIEGIVSKNGTYTGKITVIDPTGISSVAGEAAQGAVEIYNVNGVKQSTLQSGLNIVKNVKTGEVKTVSVK